jgi:hypothetical protein
MSWLGEYERKANACSKMEYRIAVRLAIGGLNRALVAFQAEPSEAGLREMVGAHAPWPGLSSRCHLSSRRLR